MAASRPSCGAGALLLALVLPAAAAAAETRTDYFAFLFDGRKIGHLVRNTAVGPEGASVEELSRLHLRQGATDVLILTRQVVETTPDGRLRRFEFDKTSGPNRLQAQGERDSEGRLRVNLRTAAGARTLVMDIPPDAVAGYGNLLARRKLQLKPGATGVVKSFEPESGK